MYSACSLVYCNITFRRLLYKDNVAQVSFQLSLLSCYVLSLLTLDSGPLSWSPDHLIPCILAVAGLQFSYHCAFLFIFLESLVVLNKLVDNVLFPLLESSWFILLSGFLPPLLYTAATVPFFYQDLIPASYKLSVCRFT